MLARCMLAVAGVIVAVGLFGCGDAAFQKGDKLQVIQDMQAQGESLWEDNTSEGFTASLPKGTTLRVLYKQAAGNDFVECDVVGMPGVNDADSLTNIVLPPHLKNRGGPTSYSLVVKLSDLGIKVQRVAAK